MVKSPGATDIGIFQRKIKPGEFNGFGCPIALRLQGAARQHNWFLKQLWRLKHRMFRIQINAHTQRRSIFGNPQPNIALHASSHINIVWAKAKHTQHFRRHFGQLDIKHMVTRIT